MGPSSATSPRKAREPSSAGHWPSGQSFEPEKDWHQEDPGAELEGRVRAAREQPPAPRSPALWPRALSPACVQAVLRRACSPEPPVAKPAAHTLTAAQSLAVQVGDALSFRWLFMRPQKTTAPRDCGSRSCLPAEQCWVVAWTDPRDRSFVPVPLRAALGLSDLRAAPFGGAAVSTVYGH